MVTAFPNDMAILDGSRAQKILEGLVGWGPVTTNHYSFGSIFEVKAPFPKGKVARGYYNAMGKKAKTLHGHLKLDNVKQDRFGEQGVRRVVKVITSVSSVKRARTFLRSA